MDPDRALLGRGVPQRQGALHSDHVSALRERALRNRYARCNATYHNDEGLNVQVYNRCVGTRYCANNCPYQVRFYNWWEPKWPERLRNQLNPDVTVRSRGIMERCSFCVQRIRRGEIMVERQGVEPLTGDRIPAGEERYLNYQRMKDGNFLPRVRPGPAPPTR